MKRIPHPFGKPITDADVTIAEDKKLVLRASWIDYKKQIWLEEINKKIDEIEKKVSLEFKKNISVKESIPITPTIYKPPSRSNMLVFTRKREQNHTILIKEINNTTEEELRDLFNPFGTITRFNCIFEDKQQPHYVYMAFISYSNKEEANNAVKAMNRKPHKSLLLSVVLSLKNN